MLWIQFLLVLVLRLTRAADPRTFFVQPYVHGRLLASDLGRRGAWANPGDFLRWGKDDAASGVRAIALPAVRSKSKDDGVRNTATNSPRRRRSWEESFALLCEYRDANGHCNVPQSEKPLGTWVNSQRIDHSRYLVREDMLQKQVNREVESLPSTSMTAQRKKALDEIGFVWDAMSHTWHTRYEEL